MDVDIMLSVQYYMATVTTQIHVPLGQYKNLKTVV